MRQALQSIVKILQSATLPTSVVIKRYTIEHEESRKKLSSDTPGAKSEVVSQALSKSINLFIEDINLNP